MGKGGRPTKYSKKFIKIADVYCRKNGATNEDLAELFDVNIDTIYEWKNRHPAFSEAIKAGKVEYDTEKVVNSLKNSANGFSFNEVTQELNHATQKMEVTKVVKKHHPPNATSLIFWLVNRNGDEWSRNGTAASENSDGIVEAMKKLAERFPV